MEKEQEKASPDNQPLKEKVPSIKRFLLPLFFVLLLLWAAGFYFLVVRKGSQPSTTPTVSPTPTTEVTSASVTPSVSIEATQTPTLQPTLTLSPSLTPTLSPTPTSSPTSTPDNRADLYISNYSFNHEPVMGEPFTVSVTIYNQGNVASGDFFWEWWATISAPTYACRENVSSIAGHGGRVVTCTYTYGGWANYTTKAIADVDNSVDESNEDNNSYTQNVIPIH